MLPGWLDLVRVAMQDQLVLPGWLDSHCVWVCRTNMFRLGTTTDGPYGASVPYQYKQVQAALRDPAFLTYTATHTYTIDWQPNYIRFFIDNKLLNIRM